MGTPRRSLTPRAAAAAIVAALAVLYLMATRAYRLGSASNPGAGMFPLLVGVALLLTAVIMAWLELRRAGPGPAAGAARPAGGDGSGSGGRMLAFGVVASAYPIAIGLMGFEAATGVALLGFSSVMGERSPLRLGVLAVLGVAVSHLLFRRLLGVPLP